MKNLFVVIFFLTTSTMFAQSWNPQSTGTTNALSGVWFTSTLDGWAVGDAGSVLVTANGGNAWTSVNLTSQDLSDIAFLNASTGVIVGDDGLIMRTLNNGISWSVATSGTASNLRAVSFGDGGMAYIGGRDGAILRSTDSGSSWTLVETGTVEYRGAAARGSQRSWIVGETGVIRSTSDGGTSWFSQTSNTFGDLHCVFFLNEAEGWVGGQNSTILHTSDGGASWHSRNNGINASIGGIFFLNANEGFAVGELGAIYHTSNAGVTWTPESSGITNELEDVFFVDGAHGWTVGDAGTILFRNPPTAIDEEESMVPGDNVLQQNFPNPFNPSTRIQYVIAQSSVVSLTLYNVIGQPVSVLVHGRKAAGHHVVDVDGSGLSSGMYLYKLEVDGLPVAVRRMVLAR